MEVHLLQDAPTKVYDAYKSRLEGVVEEQDYIDADDYSDMQTNQWESTVDVRFTVGRSLILLISRSQILSQVSLSQASISPKVLHLETLQLHLSF
jgi:hypothetical protein